MPVDVISGALIGIDILGVFTMATLERLDNTLKVSLACFAISVPMLSVFSLNHLARRDAGIMSWHNFWAFLIGIMGAIGGLAYLIDHVFPLAGKLFAASVLFGIGIFLYHMRRS